MGKFLNKNKIERYISKVKTLSFIVYEASGVYVIGGVKYTQAQLIVYYNLIAEAVDGGFTFYDKPIIILNMDSGEVETLIFADDATMNSFISTNLTPLNFLAV